MTPERLAEIRARSEAATPGPWAWDTSDDTALVAEGVWDVERGEFGTILSRYQRFVVMGSPCRKGEYDPNAKGPDAEFIAHARTDIPTLLDYIASLEAENARLIAEAELWANR